MLLEAFVHERLGLPGPAVPADHVSRQQWEIRIRSLTLALLRPPDPRRLVLTPAEVSVHYHRPVAEFVRLVAGRLG